MHDDDDGLALLAHAPQDSETLLDLLRRQDSRRLVEYEQTRVPVESLQQFDSLLLADRQVVYERVRVNRQAELVGESANLLRGLPPVNRGSRPRLRAEHDGLGDAHPVPKQ